MITKIATLSSDLRKEGLPVSIRSTQAAMQIYQDLGDSDRNLLKTALLAIYVKDRYDIPKFLKIFDEVFALPDPEKEIKENINKSKAYRGTGPKSNKYIIKKQQTIGQKVRRGADEQGLDQAEQVRPEDA